MAVSSNERFEWFAEKIGANSKEMAEEKLDAFRKKMPEEAVIVREIQVLVSWLGHEGRPMTFKAIAEDLNIEQGEVSLFRDNAVKAIQQYIARE